MKRVIALAAFVAATTCMSGAAWAIETGVRRYYWFPGITGDIKVDVTGLAGASIDLETDLDLEYYGKTFNPGTRGKSTLEYDVYDLMYQYDLVDLENILAGFSLGLAGKVKAIDGKAEIRSASKTGRKSFTAPVPMLGANLHVGVLADLLSIRLNAAGIGYSGSGIFDGQADLFYTPIPFVDFYGGYRIFFFDTDASDVELNYETSGPYVGITLGF